MCNGHPGNNQQSARAYQSGTIDAGGLWGWEVKYLVLQIGCIECGVSSYPIKCTNDLNEAIQTAREHPSTWGTEGGDGYAGIWDIELCEVVDYD